MRWFDIAWRKIRVNLGSTFSILVYVANFVEVYRK